MKRGAGSGKRGRGGGEWIKETTPNLNPSSIINFTVMYFHFSAFFFHFSLEKHQNSVFGLVFPLKFPTFAYQLKKMLTWVVPVFSARTWNSHCSSVSMNSLKHCRKWVELGATIAPYATWLLRILPTCRQTLIYSQSNLGKRCEVHVFGVW